MADALSAIGTKRFYFRLHFTSRRFQLVKVGSEFDTFREGFRDARKKPSRRYFNFPKVFKFIRLQCAQTTFGKLLPRHRKLAKQQISITAKL